MGARHLWGRAGKETKVINPVELRKSLRLLAIAALILVIYAAVSGLISNSPGAALASKGPAPEIAIKTKNGVVKLSDYKGKVVLIDFWATWCGPCRQSIPGIQKLYAEKHGEGFEVIGVAMENDNGANIPEAVSHLGMTYPVGLPVDREQPKRYMGGSLPTSALVDKHGKVRWLQEGYSDMVEVIMEENVKKLLAEK